MNAGQRSARQLASRSTQSTTDPICRNCREYISRRRYASATAVVAEEPHKVEPHIPPVSEAVQSRPAYQVKAGVVLSRPPVLTRDLHPFEKSYFLYQRRLNERLALPFTKHFYIKKGTPADIEWKRKIKTRLTPARDIGIYNPYREDGWNDELLVGAQESEPEHQVQALLQDAEQPPVGGTEAQVKRDPVDKPMPRETEADEKRDEKSLNRLLQRSLYLLVKNGGGGWTFPSDRLIRRENLHRAAERIIVQAGGLNMNTWVVGNAPIGHFHRNFPQPVSNTERRLSELGERVFFMKARIMAGQANLMENKLGLSDFKWLSKEEIEKHVHPKYWSFVRNMLAER